MNQPVSAVAGIGPRNEEVLATMGIYTVGDLLTYFPFRYENHEIQPLSEAEHQQRVTVQGTIHSMPELKFFKGKKSRLTIRILADGLLVKVVFFNQPYMKKQLILNDTVIISGTFDRHRLQITGAIVKPVEKIERGGLEPVYSIKGDLKQHQFRRFVEQVTDGFIHDIEEVLPESLMSRYQLMERKQAVYYLHFPKDEQAFNQARRRMAYEELLLFQLKMQWFRKNERQAGDGQSKSWDAEAVNAFIKRLPFELTTAQEQVLSDILSDLSSIERMNRLLQGDVGSGKTVVAAIAFYANFLAGFQGALMVPTEILAEQHAASLRELFAELKVNIAHLSGSSKVKEKREVLEMLASGEVDLIIGTHALIQEGVNFSNLGLVITDEQHRFGVAQRRTLKQKGLRPDVLFMTATPIPRTLAISAFGDMDVSTIDQLPAGRKPIKTHWGKRNMLQRVLAFVDKEIEKGHQVYVITPLIEESEALEVQNAIELHRTLTEALPHRRCGLMHGRLQHQEKEQAMADFQSNAIQLLVSTTVVEVGVNVPNATVMVIYDADRFGLAQLHQLRGRVGRGADQSHCILLADPKTEVGKERMSIMTETTDGFELSQRDLEMRGPGEFFGVRQSGMPKFKVADLLEDYRILETARNDAAKIIQSGALFEHDSYRSLLMMLESDIAFQEEKVD
ncbi:ATP-dependent DNA helicase RecG [Salisediminibacterium beveridgei]|uniref:ATP-dependent DNA helicase RecG n=1 Tax=Salisediminibacterium beveridgei TaxID=632773 RepID=A0A1D7QW40_9BACI|nr:ATP-dependent DNA helicase RecG [Salisediminibacterium beveridgei]AOM83225.1 ATP-dependent DNA helicase RecG [Salisediminibacterium beveridgei]